MHYVNPLVEKLHLVDVKAQVKRLERQEVMTCDQVRFWVLFFLFRLLKFKTKLPVVIEGDNFDAVLCFDSQFKTKVMCFGAEQIRSRAHLVLLIWTDRFG